jgi:hypothetical protein
VSSLRYCPLAHLVQNCFAEIPSTLLALDSTMAENSSLVTHLIPLNFNFFLAAGTELLHCGMGALTHQWFYFMSRKIVGLELVCKFPQSASYALSSSYATTPSLMAPMVSMKTGLKSSPILPFDCNCRGISPQGAYASSQRSLNLARLPLSGCITFPRPVTLPRTHFD